MDTILVTSDLSDSSKAAFEEAKKIAKAFEAHIKLLYVIEDFNFITAIPFSRVGTPVIVEQKEQEEIIDDAKRQLEEIAKSYFPNFKVECFVKRSDGSVYETINQFAKEINIDMLVIATHGRTGLERMLLGSIAERVTRESPCPVLLVPTKID